MRRRHKALIAVALSALMVSAVGLVDCAAPTEIVVEVRSDAPCATANHTGPAVNSTGIAIGTAADIDNKAPAAFRDTCEAPATGGIGTLVIYPSGARDAEVAIKVVAGVDNTGPEQCKPPDYAGCIVHRRVIHFVPNTTQRILVRLSLACLSRVCPSKQTCDDGVCKDESDILADGGTKADAETAEAGLADGAMPPSVDAGSADACAKCNGVCDDKGCTVNCKTTVCNPVDDCSPTLPCTINCEGTGHCNDVRCTTSASCTVNCGMPKYSCNKVTCNAGTCNVHCNGDSSCGDGGVSLDAGVAATLTCSGPNACDTASCNSPSCNLSCNGNGGGQNCPSNAPCSGGCQNWNP